MSLSVITQQEDDGRWIADIPSLKGVLVYGSTRDEAIAKVKELALQVIEDRIEHRESLPTHAGKKTSTVFENKWESVKPDRLLKGLLGAGWEIKRENDVFKILSREGHPDFVFAFNTGEEIRVRMFDWIVKQSGPVKDL